MRGDLSKGTLGWLSDELNDFLTLLAHVCEAVKDWVIYTLLYIHTRRSGACMKVHNPRTETLCVGRTRHQ